MATRLVNRTERLAVVERMLFRSSLGMRAVEIAEACGVDRRTIYRDLTLLTDVGVPIQQKDGRFFIDREHYTANVRLNLDEAIALYLAARPALRYNRHILSALDKLSGALPEALARHVHLIHKNAPCGENLSTEVLEVLVRAWGEGRKVRLWTLSSSERRLHPRAFHVYFLEPAPDGMVGVIGFDELIGRIRVLSLETIRRARLLTESYRIPSHFDPTRYLLCNLGAADAGDEADWVILDFVGDAALVVQEWHWHSPRSRLEVIEERHCNLSLQVADWRTLMPWVRSWGADVEVIKPPVMRDACAQEALQIMALYAAKV